MKPDTVSTLLKIIAQRKRLKLSKSFHLEKKKMNNPKRKLRKLRKQFHLLYHQKNKVFKDNLTKKAKTHTPEDCKRLLQIPFQISFRLSKFFKQLWLFSTLHLFLGENFIL